MARHLQYKRLLALTLLLCAAFAGLGYRLVDLQVLNHMELTNEAQKNTQVEVMTEARRHPGRAGQSAGNERVCEDGLRGPGDDGQPSGRCGAGDRAVAPDERG